MTSLNLYKDGNAVKRCCGLTLLFCFFFSGEGGGGGGGGTCLIFLFLCFPLPKCVVPEQIHTSPMEGNWKFQVVEGDLISHFFFFLMGSTSIKLNWNFQRGVGPHHTTFCRMGKGIFWGNTTLVWNKVIKNNLRLV